MDVWIPSSSLVTTYLVEYIIAFQEHNPPLNCIIINLVLIKLLWTKITRNLGPLQPILAMHSLACFASHLRNRKSYIKLNEIWPIAPFSIVGSKCIAYTRGVRRSEYYGKSLLSTIDSFRIIYSYFRLKSHEISGGNLTRETFHLRNRNTYKKSCI